MSDLQKYIKNRKSRDSKFALDYDTGYEQFKIGALLKKAREEAGFTQEELASKLNTRKSAISQNRKSCRGYQTLYLEKIRKCTWQRSPPRSRVTAALEKIFFRF